MKILKQLAVILAACLAGELISRALPIPVPGSIIGLLLLLVWLTVGRGRGTPGETGDFFLRHMQLVLIPAAASLMTAVSVLGGRLWAVVLICVLTTVLTFAATAYTVRLVTALQRRAGRKRDG